MHHQLKEYLYIFRTWDKNQKFAFAKSFFHGITVGSLAFSFNYYSFFFVLWLMEYFNIISIDNAIEPDHDVVTEFDFQRANLFGLIITGLLLICCGLPLLKWKHNTTITYGQNLSIVLIQLQISTCVHFGIALHKEEIMAEPNFLCCLAVLTPFIWSVASRLIYIFICMSSYLHQKCTN